jgi:hypothetical protein
MRRVRRGRWRFLHERGAVRHPDADADCQRHCFPDQHTDQYRNLHSDGDAYRVTPSQRHPHTDSDTV